MHAAAVVLERPEELTLRRLPLEELRAADVAVDIDYSGVSSGTERLLWSGRMPPFPGMGYPLVPGYESVGTIVAAGPESGRDVGERVFVPGARCFGEVRGLFGASASRLVAPGARVVPLDPGAGPEATLLALAATARHAIAGPVANPDLIVGHGVLGRLLARFTTSFGAPPTVWETDPVRAGGADGYEVIRPENDERRDYRAIYDASGDPEVLDELIGRLAPGGEIVLVGFYASRVSFAFPQAFMKEARFRVSAEWNRADMEAVRMAFAERIISLDGLISDIRPATTAPGAYRAAFEDPACIKMILDWRN